MKTLEYTDIQYDSYKSRDNFIASIKSAIRGMNPDTDRVHIVANTTMNVFNAVYGTNYGITGKNSEYFIKYANKVQK